MAQVLELVIEVRWQPTHEQLFRSDSIVRYSFESQAQEIRISPINKNERGLVSNTTKVDP